MHILLDLVGDGHSDKPFKERNEDNEPVVHTLILTQEQWIRLDRPNSIDIHITKAL